MEKFILTSWNRNFLYIFIPIVFLVTALSIKTLEVIFAKYKIFIDYPNNSVKKHAIHEKPVPTSTGIVFFIVFWSSIIIFHKIFKFEFNFIEILNLFLATLTLVVIGLLDDYSHVKARYKLFIELSMGFLIFFVMKIKCVNLDIFCIKLGYIAPLFYAFFYAGVINCINFVDGIDGLAGGIVAIALIMIAWLGLKTGHYLHSIYAILLFTIVLAFLIFNFYPAKVFMGDAGSMFLGGMIGYLSLYIGAASDIFYIYPVILVLYIPILDVSWAIIRRYKKHSNIFYPDKEHLHHKLLSLGFSIPQVVSMLWGITLILGIIGIMTFRASNLLKLSIYILLIVAWSIIGKALHWV